MDALGKTLQLWERGEIKSLLLEAETIQQKLTSTSNLTNIADISKKLAKLMGKRSINGALNLLSINTTNLILPLVQRHLIP